MHIVFAVSHREALISNQWADQLYSYLAGICRNRKHFVHAIGGTADHVHMLVGMNAAESVSSLVKELKGQSSHWINENYRRGSFAWQNGYAAFSYSLSMVPIVKQYIDNQYEHHRHKTFREEVEALLRKAGIEYNPAYLMQGFVEAEE